MYLDFSYTSKWFGSVTFPKIHSYVSRFKDQHCLSLQNGVKKNTVFDDGYSGQICPKTCGRLTGKQHVLNKSFNLLLDLDTLKATAEIVTLQKQDVWKQSDGTVKQIHFKAKRRGVFRVFKSRRDVNGQ